MKLNIKQITEECWTHFYIKCSYCGDNTKVYSQIDSEGGTVFIRELGKYVCLSCGTGWIFKISESKEAETIINLIKRSLKNGNNNKF